MKIAARTLTAQERRVVGILLDDWRDLLRCTTIDQAMERVGVPFSHESRLRIADFLRHDPAAAKLMRWDLSAYMLTNDEKLFARLILRATPSLGLIPDPEDLAPPSVDWFSAGIPQALETLEWVGILRRSLGGYELAPDHARFLNGIGLYFHEVMLPVRDQRFNTNCALDFFIMTHPPTRERTLAQMASGKLPEAAGEGMSQKMIDAIRGASHAESSAFAKTADYTHERAILNDACGWTHQPIGVALDHGKLVEVTPETTWYLRGGG
jgi:hypothetical protein